MKCGLRVGCFLVLVLAVATAQASVVFTPNKTKVMGPGEEVMNGNAQQLFEKAQAAEQAGNLGRAISAYGALARKYPKDALAAGAIYKKAQLLEQTHDYLKAAETYRQIVERYPKFERFDDAIEAQFRIGEMYLNGKKAKFLGLSIVNALDKAVDVFAAIVRTAPYGKYTARAQFDIGLAREKQGANDAALQAYQAVVDKFPDDPAAADAQYQIGYIWFAAAKSGTKDAAASRNAKTAFDDFLFKHPRSEKAAQAREDLRLLDTKQTNDAYSVAKFYDKQKNYRAAAIYYNDVIRQQPGSPQGDHAQRRVNELRSKFGDALQPPIATSEKKKSSHGQTAATGESSAPAMHGSGTDVAPLPPADADVSLPPPASLLPDSSTALPDLGATTALPSPASSASPEPSASPD